MLRPRLEGAGHPATEWSEGRAGKNAVCPRGRVTEWIRGEQPLRGATLYSIPGIPARAQGSWLWPSALLSCSRLPQTAGSLQQLGEPNWRWHTGFAQPRRSSVWTRIHASSASKHCLGQRASPRGRSRRDGRHTYFPGGGRDQTERWHQGRPAPPHSPLPSRASSGDSYTVV